MILEPLTDEQRIKAAQQRFRRILTEGTKLFPSRTVTTPAGVSEDCDVYWNSQARFWSSFEVLEGEGKRIRLRYWNMFGVERVPRVSRRKALSVRAEINFPFAGVYRRVRGVFGTDEEGNLYVTHNGGVGGGKGYGKERFLDYYKNAQIVTLCWDDKETKAILIGGLDDPALPIQVGKFVETVDRFKKSIRQGS